MEVYGVFQSGKWISYEPSITLKTDPRITDSHIRLAAAAYMSARKKGTSEERATSLAEAIVFKQLYPELQYTNEFEEELASLLR